MWLSPMRLPVLQDLLRFLSLLRKSLLVGNSYKCGNGRCILSYNLDLFIVVLPFFCSYASCSIILSTFPVGDLGIW